MTVKTWNWPPNVAGQVIGWSNSGKELVNRSVDDISKTEVQFDKVGSLFQYGTPAVNAGVMISGDLTEPRDISKSVLHLELLDTGSGLVSDPHRGHALSASVFKRNYPDTALAEDGEMDTVQLTFRQANGDACNILGNGVILNGYGGFFEATTTSLNPGPGYGIKQGVSVSCAIVNDVTGEEYGYIASKTYEPGGTGVLIHSSGTGTWDYNFQCKHLGGVQLEHRVSDSALILYEFDELANFYGLKVVNGVMTLFNNAGATGVFATAALTNYTPTVTDQIGGAATTATITGLWVKKSDKVRHVSIRGVMTDIGTLAGRFRFALPADASANTRFFNYWVGENVTTGVPIYGRVLYNTGYVEVYSAAGGAPCTSGQNIQIAGEYVTV